MDKPIKSKMDPIIQAYLEEYDKLILKHKPPLALLVNIGLEHLKQMIGTIDININRSMGQFAVQRNVILNEKLKPILERLDRLEGEK